jgi:hypothetical protein
MVSCYNASEKTYIVMLATSDCYWAQYAYQFAHEFCHILCGHERMGSNPNLWFHESICEMASVFTLRQMEKSWVTSPPFSNWVGYAPSLLNYAEERISREEVKLPSEVPLQKWLEFNEESLRENPYQRDLNSIIAYALLPFFELDPRKWNTVAALPTSEGTLQEYLKDWQSTVDPSEADFIGVIAEAIGCPLNN